MDCRNMDDKESKGDPVKGKKSDAKAAEGKEDNSTSDVAFLYKTMLERDPSKRRVKPVENHLLQIHFGMSDDDDTDSDYEFKPGAADSDDDIGSDEFDGVLFDGKDSSKNKDSASAKGTASEDDSEDEANLSEAENLLIMKIEPAISASRLRVEMKACCVCLSSSCGEDEIIECDGCGILVHEGCYGTVEEDVLSVHSDVSTESTEPWFCDPCKAGVTPSCELCPNQFGIFKQTDTGRWVHLICALYVPAVAFGNTEKLTNVTVLEMPYTKWGSKECSLCEDDNYSYTGVCIGCDAGMCRSFFHVTCAQKQGLLSEASIDEDIADPFYAHCRMHGDKLVSKQKKRNFLALSGHVKRFKEVKENRPVSKRTKRRLEHFKNKFKEAEARRPAAWVPPNKLPRAITSSSSAVCSLLRKAELLGVISTTKPVLQKSEVIIKKSFVAPALSVEFASYHEQRSLKIESLKNINQESLKQNKKFQLQEKKLESHINQLRLAIKELQTTHEDHRQAGRDMFTALEILSEKKIKIPEKYKQTEKLKSPTALVSSNGRQTNHPCGICDSIKEQHLLAKCDQCSKYYHLSCLDPPLTRMPKKSKSCGWVCSICDHKNHQIPAASEIPVDMEAPRSLRQSIKEPDKFVQPELKLFVEKFRRQRVSKARKRPAAPRRRPAVGPKKPRAIKLKQKTKPKLSPPTGDLTIQPSDETKEPTNTEKEREDNNDNSGLVTEITSTLVEETENTSYGLLSSAKVGRKSKILETGTCTPCKLVCNGSAAVKCDGCFTWHHFACLDPPVKKSPKPRGYQWFCDDCERVDEEPQTTAAREIGAEATQTMEIVQLNVGSEEKVVSFDGDGKPV